MTVIMMVTTTVLIEQTKKELNEMENELNTISNKLDTIENRLNSIDTEIQTQKTEIQMKTVLNEITKYYDINPPIPNTENLENIFKDFKEVEYEVPDIDSTFKSYMDFRCITDETTYQWELQQKCWTDPQGLRRYGDYYVIALGNHYVNYHCGDKFRIELSNGNTFEAIIGDVKADIHTNSTNQYVPIWTDDGLIGNIVEFIVDEDMLDHCVKHNGSIEFYDEFTGDVVSVVKIDEYVDEDENIDNEIEEEIN